MMEYYLMEQYAVTPVAPVLLEHEKYKYLLDRKNYESMPAVSIGYYEYGAGAEFPGVMRQPTFMVNRTVRDVFAMYDDSIRFKSIVLLPNVIEKSDEASEKYYIPDLKRYGCLDESADVLQDGTVKRMVLNHKKMANDDVFQIDGLIRNKVVVSLRLAESISRRSVYGIAFERVIIV